MDDNELDRLFGNGNEPEDEALNDENEAAENDDAVIATSEDIEDEAETDKESGEEAESEESSVSDEEDTDDQEELYSVTEEEEATEDDVVSHSVKDEPQDSPFVRKETRTAMAKRTPVPKPKAAPVTHVKISVRGVIFISLVLVILVMTSLIIFHPAFRVKEAHIEGNIAISDEEILEAVGLKYGSHLMSGVSGNIIDVLRLDYGKTEKAITKANPYIEDIRITVKLPSTIDIKIKERQKICYVQTPDGYAVLDRNGLVLELSSLDSQEGVKPVICGMEVQSAELGKPICITNTADYKKAIIVLGAILAADKASVGGDYSMFENTAEVRILPSGYVFLSVYSPAGELIQVKLDSLDTISDQMAWLLYVFNSDSFDKISVNGVLDMTNDEYIFREY